MRVTGLPTGQVTSQRSEARGLGRLALGFLCLSPGWSEGLGPEAAPLEASSGSPAVTALRLTPGLCDQPQALTLEGLGADWRHESVPWALALSLRVLDSRDWTSPGPVSSLAHPGGLQGPLAEAGS